MSAARNSACHDVWGPQTRESILSSLHTMPNIALDVSNSKGGGGNPGNGIQFFLRSQPPEGGVGAIIIQTATVLVFERRVGLGGGGVRKFFPYTYDQKFYHFKPFQG